MDRDSKFTTEFRELLGDDNIKPVRLPPFSPNLNSHIERFSRNLKSECLNRMIFFGESSLRRAVRQYLEHYHMEHNHQGLDNQLIDPVFDDGSSNEPLPVRCRERLGGMLRYYHRAA